MMKRQVLIWSLALSVLLSAAAPVLAQGGVHTVQWGDSLASIAATYDITVDDLMAANSISDPDLIYIGQKIAIPGGGVGADNSSYYTVVAGDTLSGIAARLNTSVQALVNANNLSGADTIYAGQVLNVPGMQGSAASGSASAPACGQYYVVQWGDTLSGIAWQSGLGVDTLLQLNNLSGNTIYAGQSLCLPAGVSSTQPANATYYTVKAGDTVAAIAFRFGVTQAAVIRANNLSSSGLIYVGQKLVVPGYNPPAPAPTATAAGSSDSGPDYAPPAAPGYENIQETWDGSMTIVKKFSKWWGNQTGDSMDPDGFNTIIVRSVDADNVPIYIKKGDFVMRVTTGTSAEFGMASFGFKAFEPGEYEIWVDRDVSDVVKARLEPGRRILVEFRYVSVSEDPAPRAPTGWSGKVVSNSSGTVDANGVWSIIVVQTGVIGVPISLRTEASQLVGTCFTGSKPEQGAGACDFGGLWPGTYTVTLEGAGIGVEVYVDGQGRAEVIFDKK